MRLKMKIKYICDDRNVYENTQKIRSMTDKEWEDYVKQCKKETKKQSNE